MQTWTLITQIITIVVILVLFFWVLPNKISDLEKNIKIEINKLKPEGPAKVPPPDPPPGEGALPSPDGTISEGDWENPETKIEYIVRGVEYLVDAEKKENPVD